MKTKSFKSFIQEDSSQTYYIDVFPNTDEKEIEKALREIIGWATYRSQNGEKVSIIGRAINEYPLLNGKK
jgi:hypothetical protein